MSNKDRTQINVNLSTGQMEQLRILSDHYGSISAAVRIALDALWREHTRNNDRPVVVDVAGNPDEDAGAAL